MTHSPEDLSRSAGEHLWMHFTRHSGLAENPPPVIVRGEGAYVFDAEGKNVAEYPLTIPDSDLAGDPVAETVPVTKGTGDAMFWYTGSKVIALSKKDLHPLWTVEGALGPGTVFAGYLLVP
ncbi:hypothetical protein ACFQ1S_23640, partial [Kibdelosporangium lantanae]